MIPMTWWSHLINHYIVWELVTFHFIKWFHDHQRYTDSPVNWSYVKRASGDYRNILQHFLICDFPGTAQSTVGYISIPVSFLAQGYLSLEVRVHILLQVPLAMLVSESLQSYFYIKYVLRISSVFPPLDSFIHGWQINAIKEGQKSNLKM